MSKITLDLETFKALASTTRLTVLRALDERRKTLTELARDLQLNKATVHEHLDLLAKAGLVKKRDDEGRKWIYYELTWTGEKLLHPQETTSFNVLLGISVAAAGGGFLMLGRALGWWLQEKAASPSSDGPKLAAESGAAAPADDGSQHAASSTAAPSGTAAAAPPATSTAPPASSEAPHQDSFFDHGGWAAVALAAATVLTASGAVWLRRRLRPKPPGPGSIGP